MSCDAITPLTFIFAHASAHDALFEDENYWKSHMNVLKRSVFLLGRQHRKENRA